MMGWYLWLVWLRLVNWWSGPAPSHGFRRVEPSALRSRRNRKPEWAIGQLVLLKAHLPDAGCRCLASTFNRVFAHHGIWVSKTWVHRMLREYSLEMEAARRAIRRAKARAADANHCWGIDMTGKADAQGAIHTILGILDHGSRRVLALKKIPRKCGWTLLGYACLAITEFGKPRADAAGGLGWHRCVSSAATSKEHPLGRRLGWIAAGVSYPKVVTAAAALLLRTNCPARERVKPVQIKLEPAQVSSAEMGWQQNPLAAIEKNGISEF